MDNTAVESVWTWYFLTQDTARRSPRVLNMELVLWLPDQKHYELNWENYTR